jgi:hypothetical protein
MRTLTGASPSGWERTDGGLLTTHEGSSEERRRLWLTRNSPGRRNEPLERTGFARQPAGTAADRRRAGATTRPRARTLGGHRETNIYSDCVSAVSPRGITSFVQYSLSEAAGASDRTRRSPNARPRIHVEARHGVAPVSSERLQRAGLRPGASGGPARQLTTSATRIACDSLKARC